MERNLKQIQNDLRAIDLKRYLLIALDFNNFDTAVISILRRWRGLTEARVGQIINLLIELGHLLKVIAFQNSNGTDTTTYAPLMFSETPENSSEKYVLAPGLITCSLYRDDHVAIGEVPVTSALYECGIKKPLVYVSTSNFNPNLVMGILGKSPPREMIPQLTTVLQDFIALFATGSLERFDVQVRPMLLKGGHNGDIL